MKTLKTLLAMLLLAGASYAQDNLGEIHGKLIDTALNEPMAYTSVFVKMGESKVGATTNADGSFIIKPLPAGTYNLYFNSLTVGEVMVRKNVKVKSNKICFLNEIGLVDDNTLTTIDVIEWADPLIDPEDPSAQTMDAERIAVSAVKNDVKALITTLDSSIKQDANGELTIRGNRPGNVVYLVDGVKTRSPQLPGAAYENITAYTGGLPAKYGDTTGGVIIVESKSYFDYYRAWKAQQDQK